MKMMRWLVRVVFLLLVSLLGLGAPPLRAATAQYSSTCDEHPWDVLQHAYRTQILAISESYILAAVWYTKSQILPVIVRINIATPDGRSGSKKAVVFRD